MRAPILTGELELTASVSDIRLPARPDGTGYQGVRLLVRMQGMPVGYACLPPVALDAASIAVQVWRQLGPDINARRARHGLPPLSALPTAGVGSEDALAEPVTHRPLVSVVMNTR